MIGTIFILICFATMLFLSWYGFARVIKAPLLPRTQKTSSIQHHLSVKELSIIEGGIINLREVIIVADRIEEPTNDLYVSVMSNLKKGVKYIFLISGNSYERELSSYWKIFEAIAQAIKHNYNVENVLEIHPLKCSWDDYPYVFYRYFDKETDGLKAVAYMGTEQNEGIADGYEAINPTIASKILNLAFAGMTIPTYENITKEELYDSSPKIVPIHQIA